MTTEVIAISIDCLDNPKISTTLQHVGKRLVALYQDKLVKPKNTQFKPNDTTYFSSGDTGPGRCDHSSGEGYNHCNTLLMKVKRGVEEGVDVNENSHPLTETL